MDKGRGQVVSDDLREHQAARPRASPQRPGLDRDVSPSHVRYCATNTRRYPSCALGVLARRAYVSAVAAHSRPQIRNNGDHKTRSDRLVRVDVPVAS